MILPRHHLSDILNGRRTTALIPKRDLAENQPVRRKDGPVLCRVKIIGVAVVVLDGLTDDVARAEGYRSLEEWREDWRAMYGRELRGEGLVVEFEVLPPRERKWLLAQRGGDYTEAAHLALEEEPEGVDPGVIEGLPASMEAQQRWNRDRLNQQRAREALPLADRVALALESARASGVDTKRYEQQILGRVRALENRSRRAA